MDGPELSWGAWLLAALPVAALFALVASGLLKTKQAAGVVLAIGLVVAAGRFGAGTDVVAVGLGKGLWLGAWVLLIMAPALLLYRLAAAAGFEAIGGSLRALTDRPAVTLLAFAWVLPAFIQGVAGFGTPIAVCAPLLVAMGWSPVRAVAACLVGYHWSVTFGSMGSSFYMASLTAGFGPGEQGELAAVAATLLAINALAAGALMLLLDGGPARLREGGWLLVGAGLPMGATLIGVAQVVPALATLSAGTVGAAVLLPLARYGPGGRAAARARAAQCGATDDDAVGAEAGSGRATARGAAVGEGGSPRPRPLVLVSPYLVLLGVALAVLLPPWTRAWAEETLVLAPSFPATGTELGWANEAVNAFTPFAPLAHPGSYLLLACAAAYVIYRLAGLWGEDARAQRPVRAWARTLPGSAAPVLLLAALAMLLVDAGMISVLARGVAEATGGVYPVLAPVVGALGSFMTGSTTASNALFSALQADVAGLIDAPEVALIAAQTVGGNAGNSLAPVVAVLGATAVGEPDAVAAILRRCLLPVAVLLALTASTVSATAALLG